MKIILSLPPSINQTYKTTRNGGFYKSEKAKQWEKDAGWEIKKQWKKKSIKGKVYLGIHWYFKRDRDISSGIKLLEDLLQQQQVYMNDSQIYQENIIKRFDRLYPRVEIEVEELME